MSDLGHHQETSALVAALPDAVFAYVDDPRRLSAHMEKSSWAMGGARMKIRLDEAAGRAAGSKIGLAGRAFGVELSLEEVVVERTPPQRKVWQTIGSPRLLVIGHYRMGFDLAPRGKSSLLRVFIDYALPEQGIGRWLGRLFGRAYAAWCTRRMVNDAVLYFGG
jgi:hypothetical protein